MTGAASPAMTDIVQRRGRSHGRGNSSLRFVADQTIDARAKTRDSPRRTFGSAVKHAHQRLITDVSRLRSHPCTIIRIEGLRAKIVVGKEMLRSQGLTWDVRAYFRHYMLADARTAWTAGVGPNWRSRLGELSRPAFLQRHIGCLIAFNLKRLSGTLADANERRRALEMDVRDAVGQAIERARHDLDGPLEAHLATALAE